VSFSHEINETISKILRFLIALKKLPTENTLLLSAVINFIPTHKSPISFFPLTKYPSRFLYLLSGGIGVISKGGYFLSWLMLFEN